MKLTELILQLHTIMLEKGNLNVYVVQPDWDTSVEDPQVRVVEGGDYCRPYPGVYLN